MTGEEIIKAFVQALLATPGTTATKTERRPAVSSNPPQQMPLGLSPEQIVDLIDRRVEHIIAQGDTPGGEQLNTMTPGWLEPEEMRARQERTNGTYRPDGDYPDGQAGATMPWIAPLR